MPDVGRRQARPTVHWRQSGSCDSRRNGYREGSRVDRGSCEIAGYGRMTGQPVAERGYARPGANVGRHHVRMEEVLGGGTLSQVVRVGDTVRRPVSPWSSTMHRLLRHLEAKDFPAPRFRGIDDQGREVLTYVEGSAALRPWPSQLRSDRGVRELAALLRRYHDVVVNFDPGPEAAFCTGTGGLGPGVIVCHGDLGASNTIWDERGHLTGFIDWDLAQPASPVRDVAQLAYYVCPLRADRVWREAGLDEAPDFKSRLEGICASYGEVSPPAVVSELEVYLTETVRRVEEWGRAGRQPWATYATRGGLTKVAADAAWLAEHRERLI